MSLGSAPAKGPVQVGELPQQVLPTLLGSLDQPQLLELSLANGEDFAKPKPKNLKNSGWMVCATRGWESFLFACIFEWHNSSSYVSQNFLQKQGENLISKKKDGYWLFLLLVQQTKSVAFTAVFNCSTTFSFDSNKDHWGCGL